MNKVFFSVCICLSFCITACQTLADEVQKVKHPVSVSETAPASVTEADKTLPWKKPALAEQLKIIQVRALDPAVFTMIRPYTLDRSPVKLPQDQILD